MISIEVTPQIEADAEQAVKELWASGHRKDANKLRVENGDWVGFVGEYALQDYFNKQGLNVKHHTDHSKPSPIDYWFPYIANDGTERVVEIDLKTGSKPDYKYLMFPKSQGVKAQMYIGALYTGTAVDVYGYALPRELRDITNEVKTQVPSWGRRLDELHDISKLIERGVR